jgi:hypothetical protein
MNRVKNIKLFFLGRPERELTSESVSAGGSQDAVKMVNMNMIKSEEGRACEETSSSLRDSSVLSLQLNRFNARSERRPIK